MQTRTLLLVGLLGMLGGCASDIPQPIRVAPPNNPTITAVLGDVKAYVGAPVRWGGSIASVENKAHDTWVVIVARPLDSDGEPIDNDRTLGRFIARVDGFLDPDIYSKDREVTVYGTVESRVTQMIGKHPYTYPLIKASTLYLWRDYPEAVPYYPYPYPYWYYDPYFYPFYRYPYWYPYRRPGATFHFGVGTQF